MLKYTHFVVHSQNPGNLLLILACEHELPLNEGRSNEFGNLSCSQTQSVAA